MGELLQPVGIGLAARGDVDDVVGWADDARKRGLDSVWIHDSYFERDAVSYASAIAARVPDIKVALGALNPLTRHPVVLAMTISAIDDMAPGRVILGMGTGLPLRLAQMGIPYNPDAGVESVSKAIDTVRSLWRGERIPSGTPGLPPVQPMFAPVHNVPIYIAAYRTPFLKLAGQKADGYLSRPAESVANLRRMVPKIRAASLAAGRPENAVNVAGYLLTFIDKTRREALNRAKREPFVIYMMAVLSDFSLEQVGFDKELRDAIMVSWRAEDYHKAAGLIPDEMLDAFILCGTREDVAAKAAQYVEAGMDLPLLQPCVQDDDQVQAIFDAAVLYGNQKVGAPAPARAEAPVTVAASAPMAGQMAAASATASAAVMAAPTSSLADDRTLSAGNRIWRHITAWAEIARPFSFTASIVPVAAGGALAALNGLFNWPLFLAALFASVLLHIGTNVTNEIYDVRKGVDTITSPRASHAILKGRIREGEAFAVVGVAFGIAALLGIYLIIERGWPILALGLIALVGGWGYTAPPLQYKYRTVGLPLVFMLMGPLMVVGSYYTITGLWSWQALALSVPVGLLVTAILHGNEWRDITDDARMGSATLSIRFGRRAAYYTYISLVVGAYMALSISVLFGWLPPASLLAMLSMPLLVRQLRDAELGVTGQQRAIAKIDLETAQLHAAFGALMVLGLLLPVFVPRFA
jgi:1,4-dihydroxy-2-naphthoate octaprenyltransferase